MKKDYKTPVVEKVTFDYSQVVTASGSGCWSTTTYNISRSVGSSCKEIQEWNNLNS